jgi:hypothetical protein
MIPGVTVEVTSNHRTNSWQYLILSCFSLGWGINHQWGDWRISWSFAEMQICDRCLHSGRGPSIPGRNENSAALLNNIGMLQPGDNTQDLCFAGVRSLRAGFAEMQNRFSVVQSASTDAPVVVRAAVSSLKQRRADLPALLQQSAAKPERGSEHPPGNDQGKYQVEDQHRRSQPAL